jgi:hypothetical protein
MIRRREFMTLLACTTAWPVAAFGQQAMRVIGFLNGASAQPFAHVVGGFRQG